VPFFGTKRAFGSCPPCSKRSLGSCTGFGTPTRPMETNRPSFGVLLFVLRVESASKASPWVSVRSSGPSMFSSFDFGFFEISLREFRPSRVFRFLSPRARALARSMKASRIASLRARDVSARSQSRRRTSWSTFSISTLSFTLRRVQPRFDARAGRARRPIDESVRIASVKRPRVNPTTSPRRQRRAMR